MEWRDVPQACQRLLTELYNHPASSSWISTREVSKEVLDSTAIDVCVCEEWIGYENNYEDEHIWVQLKPAGRKLVARASMASRRTAPAAKTPIVDLGNVDGASGDSVFPWRAHRDGIQLRGWKDITAALESSGNRRSRENLKRLHTLSGGPIFMVGRRPEVDHGELIAWIRDAQGRSAAAEVRRASKQSAASELRERDGLRAQDSGAHIEKRPNARGKAREANKASSRRV